MLSTLHDRSSIRGPGKLGEINPVSHLLCVGNQKIVGGRLLSNLPA